MNRFTATPRPARSMRAARIERERDAPAAAPEAANAIRPSGVLPAVKACLPGKAGERSPAGPDAGHERA